MKQVTGGVCAAQGFSAAGIHCGIRRNQSKRDLALIYSAVPASAAAVYTSNLVKGAPLTVTKAHLSDGRAQAVICNSGNANTCNADGIAVAEAAEGIMTTDTHRKEIAVQFTAGGKTCTIGGIAKGSGMIHPNLATMLVFLTTDCAVSPAMLQAALSGDVQDTFNMVSVDGDTSTNDMVAILANGLAGNAEITAPGADFTAFCRALNSVTVWLCRQIAGDGEGATRLLECCVTGAADHATAKAVAKSIICSSLVKAAMFGADANWGRVLCAIGYSGADVDVHKVDVAFRSAAGTVRVCVDGAGIPFSEEEAKQVLLEKEIEILVDLRSGDEGATAWGCDLTYDYVKINGDYRT